MKLIHTMLALTTGVSLALSVNAAALPTVANTTDTTDAKQASAWQPLFDGSSASLTEHWRTYQQPTVHPAWQVKQDALCLSKAGGGDLISKQSFQHFELELQWNIEPGGNSGIFILADESAEHIYAKAPEIQILDNERHKDNKLATHRSGSLYDMIASPDSSHKVAGEWNQVRIVLNNKHLQVWQNGVATADLVIGSAEWQRLLASSKFANWPGFGSLDKGHIGLQDHGDPVCFKNIRIRELRHD